MSVLSNAEIYKALDDGRLVIDPEPTPRFVTMGSGSSPYNNTSVDLTLAGMLQVPPNNLDQFIVDLSGGGSVTSTLNRLYDPTTIDQTQGYQLKPGAFVLGETDQRVKLTLPEDFPPAAQGRPCLAARIEGRSSFARFGLLVHFTAPTIQAGFEGTIKLEIKNLGPATIVLKRGLAIAQLVIEEVVGSPIDKPSQFQGQGSSP